MLTACHAGQRAGASVGTPSRGTIESFGTTIPELERRPREIRVYLPAGYDDGERRYPVMYMQDGQQLFQPGPFGDWLIDETLDTMSRVGRYPGVIVVGIDNSSHRWDEYSPWVNRHMHDWVPADWSAPVQGGEGAAYLDFVTNTLKPEIDARYRTMTDRGHTAIGGSSMGGLIALYGGIRRPDVFGSVMAMSTAVWFAEEGGPWLSRNHLLEVAASRPLPRDVRFYVDVGTAERSRDTDPDVTDARGEKVTYPRAYVEGNDALVHALRRGGVPESHLHYVVAPNAVHNESAWARRVASAMHWLFR